MTVTSMKPPEQWDYIERANDREEQYRDLIHYLRRNELPDGPPSLSSKDLWACDMDFKMIATFRDIAWQGPLAVAGMLQEVLETVPKSETARREYLTERIYLLHERYRRTQGDISKVEASMRRGKPLPELYLDETL